MAIHHHLVMLASHRYQMACTMPFEFQALSIKEGVALPAILDLSGGDSHGTRYFLANASMDVVASRGLCQPAGTSAKDICRSIYEAHISSEWLQLATGHRPSTGSSPGR